MQMRQITTTQLGQTGPGVTRMAPASGRSEAADGSSAGGPRTTASGSRPSTGAPELGVNWIDILSIAIGAS
jgi:hypothetical protein